MLQISRWQVLIVISTILMSALFALPNLFSKSQLADWPSYLPNNKVALGLDLRGGAHLLLQADDNLIKKDYNDSLAADTARALNQGGVKARRIDPESTDVKFRLSKNEDSSKALRLLENNFNRVPGAQSPQFSVTNGIVAISASQSLVDELISAAVAQSIGVLHRRIDSLGVAEASIAPQGKQRILVQVPGLSDPERLKEIIGRTARLTFHLVAPRQPVGNQHTPAGLLEVEGPNGGRLWVQRRALLSGSNLVDAKAEFDQNNQPVVGFRLDSAGAVRFARVTAKNVGKAFAAVLDGRAVSAPVIREAIPGGAGSISGGFSLGEASDLALLLRAGALPTKLTIVEERVVGPGLGSDSIAAGELASVIALVTVLVFMLLVYRKFGAIACVALIINMIMLLGVLSFLQAALTLPGIAGIILTIGMAVDANVLIFERIREELEGGKVPIAAVDAGFSSAREPIIDANITTLIAAIILFSLGSGPVRGFAVTLSLGTITSVFTAYMVTRLIAALWMLKYRPKKIFI